MDKKERREKTKKRIDDLFDKLEVLEEKFKNASETRKLELKREMDDARKLRDDLQIKYNDLQRATGSSAKGLKAAFEESARVFKERIDKISQNFKRSKESTDKQES